MERRSLVTETADGAGFALSWDGDMAVLHLRGPWLIRTTGDLDAQLRALDLGAARRICIDMSGVTQLDTTGAWLIERLRITETDRRGTNPVVYEGRSEDFALIMRRVCTGFYACEIEPPRRGSVYLKVSAIGESVVHTIDQAVVTMAFGGRIIQGLGRWIVAPWRIRMTSFVYHVEETGLNALPIIALMSFLIGAVLAFLGADILAQFGTQIFVVNLLSYAVLREFGVLLTAIMIAGRSGSAFTAQIGSMKGREEIDAMRTLGLDPVEILVLPRVLALVVAAPLLTIMADFAGLFGGGIVAWTLLDISPGVFLSRLKEVTEFNYFLVGLIKAPIFAFIIAMIGCYQGMQVEGNAESVGRRTTRSVVEAIFVVIIADALFAIYFLEVEL